MSDSWNDVHVDINQKELYEVELAFEGLWVLAFLIFIAATVLIRLRKHEGAKVLPLWAIFAAQFLYLLVAIFQTVDVSQNLQAALGAASILSWGTPAATRYYTLLAFEQLFRALAAPLTFYVFYSVIHLVLGALGKMKNPYWKTRIFHWACLALLTAFSLVVWCLETAIYSWESRVEYESREGLAKELTLIRSTHYIQAAYYILLCLAAWENMGWTIFLAIKTVRSRTRLMLPSLFLLFGGIFWFAMNFLSTLSIIAYTIIPATSRPNNTTTGLGNTVITVVTVIMSLTSWTGILLFCFRFASVQKEGEGPSPVQNREDWAETSHLSPPSPSMQHSYRPPWSNESYSSWQEDPQNLAAEADSSTVRGEMEAGRLCHEADAGRPIHEADASNALVSLF
ncbi:hypothetical protein N7448_004249 [Penicillium atrosanguineum]|uniref:Uncharacterized protein n=1 Tax=Penicillium atrosanguineum TaxID=1132637 RepID=A0A9W9HAR8_9EURO|nr:uncharacterized protein N7443_003214 [Penicillium atrosanguineum]KAJ5140841.1 hypothetical protein N7448_004249 [Penicillium atrosanguineum]KAJ5310753.1 hypothetical protein N7443_003214 [Penicillium atrosanguineum]KAJ5316276.1 hypothetical protein N7476_006583 [Penicillium atrosanguineum]